MSLVPCAAGKKYAGFTLLEMLLVIAIISIVATIAIQSGSPVQTTSLDTAAQQTLQALQFARQEAQRTNANASVSFDTVTGELRVSRLDFSTGTPVEQILTHPLTKSEYRLPLGSQRLSGTALAVDALFRFSDGTSASAIGFNNVGAPGKVVGEIDVTPLQITGNWRGLWQPAVSYVAGDWVVFNNENYDCVSNHNSSSSFSSDASRWQKRTALPHITLSASAHRQVLHVAPATGFARIGAW